MGRERSYAVEGTPSQHAPCLNVFGFAELFHRSSACPCSCFTLVELTSANTLPPFVSLLQQLILFQEAIQGQTLRVIQGPCTDANALDALKSEIQRGRATSSLLLNYKRDGTMFLNYLRIYPLIGDARGTITHFLGVLQVCVCVIHS